MNSDLGSFDFTLATQTTYSTDPILEFMFDTAAEATAQANLWGFDGYRAYLVNGTIKYIPCSTAAEYQQATRLYIHQGDIVPQGKDVFGDKLVGYQFTEKDNIKGDPIYTMGNFSITTTVTQKENAIFTLADTKRGYTAADFTQDGIEALKSQIIGNVNAKVRFDPSNLEKYVTYSSLSERFNGCMQEIAETFPASMHVVPYSITETSVFDYTAYPNGDAAIFKIRLGNIINPYAIDYFRTGTTATQQEYVAALRNFAKNYSQYEVYYNGTAYQIISVILPTQRVDPNGLVLTVKGDPFAAVVTSQNTANVNFYIKPILSAINDFYVTATSLTAYLLNPKSVPLYAATFNVPHRLDDGSFQVTPKLMRFPMYDDFNVDIFNDQYDKYTTDLQFIADEFDRYKTDLIARFLTAESLQGFDTEDRKTYVTWQTYGAMFDNVKKFADGISYMTNVSYDKIDNIPDVLLKNFAHTLGWKTYEIEQDSTLVESLFNVSADRQGDDTPQEIDIELWRRIIINSFYLFKSKGTRKSIEFILEIVGIPIEIMDINEYVYVAEHSLPYGYYYNLFHEDLALYPIDRQGYPTTPPNLYFQAYGGNMLNNAQNKGAYDNGKAYMDTFRKFGKIKAFDLHKTIDNKKVWVASTGNTQQYYDLMLRDTNYQIKDSRLVINSKEADAAISSQMTFDYYVYSFYNKNNYVISVSGATVDPSALTFNDYIREITTKLIDPKNRKVVKTYPVLSKIYWDYLEYAKTLGLQTIDYANTLGFMAQFDSYWVKLVQQFVPATTIFLAGKKYANANITRSKFPYKHGLRSATGWTGTDGSEFQDSALKPSPVGNLDIFQTEGYLGTHLDNDKIRFQVDAYLAERANSYLARGGYYDADNYNFYRHYGETANVLGLAHGNYGTMTGLTLNTTGATIAPSAHEIYFLTKNSSITDIKLGHQSSTSGTTTDPHIGVGIYAGYVTSGTTGSTFMTIGALPASGDTLYPLHTLLLFALHFVPVVKYEYYVAEADIMLETQISGNTAYSYIGLFPVYTGGSITPDLFISEVDRMEGCLGKGAYDKYNWVHMKTKFKPTAGLVNIAVVAQDINYVGTGRVRLKNFTVTKVPTDINFITPPPLPHICYYDYDGFGTDLLSQVPTHPEFQSGGLWGIGIGGTGATYTPSITGDSAEIRFNHTGALMGRGGISLTYLGTYHTAPADNTLYYYRISANVNYTGSTLTHEQNPTIYMDLFDEFDGDVSKYLIKLKGGSNASTITFEGYYVSGTIPVIPYIQILVDNTTALDADYYVTLSNLTIQRVDAYYESENNELFWYRQPHAFGYSLNNLTINPDYAIGGSANEWMIPFLPVGHTGETGDVAGLYEEYVRSTGTTTGNTTPLMHVSTAYVDKYDKDAVDLPIDINLTHTCGLGYQFYQTGATLPTLCITPRGVTIENQMFMSGALDITFEGFYPTTGSTLAGLGPFYTSKSVYGIYGNVGLGDVSCVKNKNTRIPIVNSYGDNWAELRADTGYTVAHPHVPQDFNTALTTVTLASRSNNNYLVASRYNLIKVEASLIYDSTTESPQTVVVKLMGADDFVYNQKSYTVGGSSHAEYASVSSRTLSYTFEGFYYVNDEIYLTVQPQSYDCSIKQNEAIDVVGGYILSGSTGSTYSLFKGDKYWNSAANGGVGAWVYTIFTGTTYQYMINSVYDTIRFTPTGVSGHTAPTEVYDNELEYYMCFASGVTVSATGRTIMLQSMAVDRSQYSSGNQFIYGIKQLPPPFTGVTWTEYSSAGVADPHYKNALTGTTFSVIRNSYIKVYESDVTGIDDDLAQYLIAFYKKNNRLYYKYGYSKYFFDDPINRFYVASDATSREVFPYGTTDIHVEPDGIYLTYNYAKDLAGYPISGEFIGRLTAKDPCGNFSTTYFLLCMNVKSTAVVTRIGSVNSQIQLEPIAAQD